MVEKDAEREMCRKRGIERERKRRDMEKERLVEKDAERER